MSVQTTAWDLEETRAGGPFVELLNVDVFVNAVFLSGPTPPFMNGEMLERPRRLRVVSDVSCDPNSPFNPVPIYDRITTFDTPARRVAKVPPLWVVAIDHLPSLLPKESSEDFAEQLLPHLLELGSNDAVWARAQDVFQEKTRPLRDS